MLDFTVTLEGQVQSHSLCKNTYMVEISRLTPQVQMYLIILITVICP